MKYLLLPVTFILWVLITYFGLYYATEGLVYMFLLDWIWLILSYPLLIILIFWLLVRILSLIRYMIFRLYGFNWFSCIVYSAAGISGFGFYMLAIAVDHPSLPGYESVFLLQSMWDVSPLKTIVVIIPFAELFAGLFVSMVVSPIYLKVTRDSS